MVSNEASASNELSVAVGAWDAASKLDVQFVGPIRWHTLERFEEQSRRIYRLVDGTGTLSRLIGLNFQVIRTLKCSPTGPDASGLTDVIAACNEFIHSSPRHSVTPALQELLSAAQALFASSSPLQSRVEAELSKYGEEEDGPWEGQPASVIIVPSDLAESTRDFLETEELVADVCTPEQAKLRHYQGAIVCGDLALAYRSFWRSQEMTAKTYGWLVTAPPADRLVVIRTSGHDLHPDSLWLLGANHHPTLAIDSGEVASGKPPPEETLPVTSPPPPVSVRFSNTRSDDGYEMADQIILASRRRVFFAKKRGPQPRVVLVGEAEVEIYNSVEMTWLNPGDHIVIRLSGSDYEQVRFRAEKDLLENKGWKSEDIAHARDLVGQLKQCLGLAIETQGETSLVKEMVQRGLSERYARSLCRNALGEHYIAPAPHKGGFGPLVQAIGAPDLIQHESILRDLRTAHRQAGRQVTKELRQRLSEGRSWIDELDVKGFVVVGHDTLGMMVIETVESIGEPISNVPVSYLGRLLDGNPLSPVEKESFGRR